MNLRRQLARKEGRLYNALPLIVFGGTTFVGCIIIAISKLAGVNPFLTMAIPIALMLGYWGLSYSLKRIQLHDEQTGDNLYYMGFLFTLTSLGVSLYQFTSDGSMDDVVRNFGIAITSTIFGIALRILFNQTRRDVQDIERATRHDIATMARLVRTEMESARREFNEFRRINNQIVIEGFDDVIKHTDKASKKMMDTLENMANDAVKPFQDAAIVLRNAMADTVTNITAKLGSMSTMLDDSASKIQSTATKINDIQLSSDVIKNELKPVIEQLGKVVIDLAARMEDLRADQNKIVNALSAKIEETRQEQNAATRSVTEGVTKLVGEMRLSVAHMEKIILNSEKMVQSSQEVVRANEEMMKATTRTTNQFQEVVTRAETQVQKSEKQTLELKDILAKLLGLSRSQPPASTASASPEASGFTSVPPVSGSSSLGSSTTTNSNSFEQAPYTPGAPPSAAPLDREQQPQTASVGPWSVQ
jgi:methyl-accepting chemotaxis protein